MFSLKEYIKKGFLDAVGKMSNYQIILNSAGWMEKGVLTEEDLTEINTAIEAWEAEQNTIYEPVDPSEEIPVEDIVEEMQNAENTDVSDEGEEVTTEEETGADLGESEATDGIVESETVAE